MKNIYRNISAFNRLQNIGKIFIQMMAVACWLGTLAPAAHASTDNRLEKFFKNPEFTVVRLSPNGKHLAASAAVNGRMHLVVIDLDTRAVNSVAGFTDADVCGVRWTGNDRLVFTLIDRDSDVSNSCGNGLFAVNRDGTKLVELMATLRKQIDHIKMTGLGRLGPAIHHFRFVGENHDDPNEIFVVEHNSRSEDANLYEINSISGRKKSLYVDVKGSPTEYVLDNQQRVRLVMTKGSSEAFKNLWYRDDDSAPWKKLAEISDMNPQFSPLMFDADNTTLYVIAHGTEDRAGVYKYDLVNNKLGEQVAADPAVDVFGDTVIDQKKHKLVGIRIASEPPKTLWFDKGIASAQDEIDAAVPGRINELSGEIDSRMIVFSYSATDPGTYSLYDPATRKLEYLFSRMPWIKPEQMSDQLLFDYAARDGLHIPSYLTIPAGREMKSLPLIVLPHGGPWMRDQWGFDPIVQFLADLGYAVLQPQFRGSVGFGLNHFRKGWKQWGLSMQDDISDGVDELVKQGVVDAKRVCIMGASYGGYATMMGLVKDPARYRCGIDLMGPTDIEMLFTRGIWSGDDGAQYAFGELIGERDKMHKQFAATSPVRHADRIEAPVFMAYGEKDERVPLAHGEKMRDALRAQKKYVEWTEMEGEEHGFSKEENRYKVFGGIEKFLRTYNPAGQDGKP